MFLKRIAPQPLCPSVPEIEMIGRSTYFETSNGRLRTIPLYTSAQLANSGSLGASAALFILILIAQVETFVPSGIVISVEKSNTLPFLTP